MYLRLLIPLLVASWHSPTLAQSCATDLSIDLVAPFEDMTAFALSGDGSVAVGRIGGATSTNHHAFRWTAAGGTEVLNHGTALRSIARQVSSDGRVVVGEAWISNGRTRAVRWVDQQPMEFLTPAGTTGSTGSANDVSADGTVIVGAAVESQMRTAFVWTETGGLVEVIPAGAIISELRFVSDSGDVALGTTTVSGTRKALLWRSSTGIELLDGLTSDVLRVQGLSADGRVAIGSDRALNGDEEPLRWVDGLPAESLQSEFPDGFGLDSRLFRVNTDGSRYYGIAAYSDVSWTMAYSERLGLRPVLPRVQGPSPTEIISDDGRWVVLGEIIDNVGALYVRRLGDLGEPYCGEATLNSTGCHGSLFATGSTDVGQNQLSLQAEDLPASVFGFFLIAPDPALVYQPPGTAGVLCLGGSIGRFVGPGQIQNSGAAGTIRLDLDLGSLPSPNGSFAAQPGQTWMFQAWHRDTLITVGSNFTTAVAVTLH